MTLGNLYCLHWFESLKFYAEQKLWMIHLENEKATIFSKSFVKITNKFVIAEPWWSLICQPLDFLFQEQHSASWVEPWNVALVCSFSQWPGLNWAFLIPHQTVSSYHENSPDLQFIWSWSPSWWSVIYVAQECTTGQQSHTVFPHRISKVRPTLREKLELGGWQGLGRTNQIQV